MNGSTTFSGKLTARVIRGKCAPLLWRLHNIMRISYLWNLLTYYAAKAFSKITGVVTMTGRLHAVLRHANGETVNYGWLSHGLVTTAFVNFMVDQLQTETSVWGDFKYHDSGVGTTAANIADTDIETTDGEDRSTGDQGEGASANIYQSIGTISYTTTKAITEHGIFNASTGVTLLDRHVFSAINVVDGDSVQFTYQLTCNAES
jgi:hypothetical protein